MTLDIPATMKAVVFETGRAVGGQAGADATA